MIPKEDAQPSERGILGKLAKVYDPLGLVAPLTLTAKQIYGEVCQSKAPWDAQLEGEFLHRGKKWEQQLSQEEQVPRAILHFKQAIEEVELHSFGGASKRGVGAAVYAVVCQKSDDYAAASDSQEWTRQARPIHSTPGISVRPHGHQPADKRSQCPRQRAYAKRVWMS